MPTKNTRLLLVEHKDGTMRLVDGEVAGAKDGYEVVRVDELGSAFLLRPEHRRILEGQGKPRAVWPVKDGFPSSTAIVPALDAKGNNGREVVLEDATPAYGRSGQLVEVRAVPDHEAHPLSQGEHPDVEDVDSHYLFSLLDDRAVGDYLAGKVFVPFVQVAIIIGCIAAVLAVILAGLSWHQATQIAQAQADHVAYTSAMLEQILQLSERQALPTLDEVIPRSR